MEESIHSNHPVKRIFSALYRLGAPTPRLLRSPSYAARPLYPPGAIKGQRRYLLLLLLH